MYNKRHRKKEREDIDKMAEIVYINEEEALKRLGGNKVLYSKLLKRFVDDLPNHDVSKYIADGDIKNAQAEAHTVKGMAANLSLIAAYEEATKLDSMLKNNTVDPNILQEYEKIIAETVSEVNKYLGL